MDYVTIKKHGVYCPRDFTFVFCGDDAVLIYD